MTDGQRAADEDNPEGYWEWEEIRRLPGNPRLIEQAHGKAIKVIAPLLPALPPKHRYRIIFMTRPVAEIVTSQARMLGRRGQSPRATASHLEQTQQEHASQCLRMLHASPRAEILEVPYPDLIADPAAWAARIAAFLGPDRLPAAGSMAAAVRPELHRNRSPGDA